MRQTHGPSPSLVTLDEAHHIDTYDLREHRDTADALEALGGVVLDRNSGKPEGQEALEQAAFDHLMSMNRREARRHGFRGARKQGRMAIPRGKR